MIVYFIGFEKYNDGNVFYLVYVFILLIIIIIVCNVYSMFY